MHAPKALFRASGVFLYMSLGKWQIKCLLTEGGDVWGCLVANCSLKTSCLSLVAGKHRDSEKHCPLGWKSKEGTLDQLFTKK